MTSALWAVFALGWLVALVLLVVLPARARRRGIQASLLLKTRVHPYLLRHAVELGLEPRAPGETPDLDGTIASLCELIDEMQKHERSQLALGDTMNIGAVDTVPVDQMPSRDR